MFLTGDIKFGIIFMILFMMKAKRMDRIGNFSPADINKHQNVTVLVYQFIVWCLPPSIIFQTHPNLEY